MDLQPRQPAWLPLALGLCALVLGGCAGLRLPRIDPTGERIFIWPRDQVPAVSPTAGNLVAPPVFTDPVFPQPATPAPGGSLTPGIAPTPVGGLVPPVPQDRLTITPNRVLAPVGSEVILKAGLCTAENFLLTKTKTDWIIAQDSAGEFVSLGGRGWCRNPLLPWNKPKKIDNQYATGYSAEVPLTITRGTQDAGDDVRVEPGEAWATVTSPVEGTSHITAVAPEVVNWSGRRATATIYWVDVEWTFPPATVSAGGAQVLTTTVRRQTDGTPIEGWLVRYEVADGTGALTGNQSGQVVEAPTDADGRASIDVTPTGGSGTATRINTQIIRPARFAGSDMPRLVIANGSSTINWTDGSTPYLPPADDLGANPLPSLTPTPAPPPIVTQRPVLEIEIRGASQTEVGSQARFEVIIRNQGNATATGVKLSDRFDEGLSHLRDSQRFLNIEKNIVDIAPGASHSEFLSFDVLRAGNLCHDVTVTCRECEPSQKRACITATQAPPQRRPGLEVRKSGPELKEVGQTALFTLTIKNTGEAPLTNIEVVDEYDKELSPQPTRQGYRIVNNAIFWTIPRLEVGQTLRLDVNCRCQAPKEEACSTVQVSANTGTGVIPSADNHCIHILPSRDVVPAPDVVPQPGGVFPTNPVAPGGLALDLRSLSAIPARVGTPAKYEIVVVNNSATSDNQLRLRVLFPAGIVPDPASLQG
ncbi:MAG: hypothetical protein MI725_08060, partial [Pirellulales bacterium]|nr:hypothetical protein [Pirellulales bacterium]